MCAFPKLPWSSRNRAIEKNNSYILLLRGQHSNIPRTPLLCATFRCFKVGKLHTSYRSWRGLLFCGPYGKQLRRAQGLFEKSHKHHLCWVNHSSKRSAWLLVFSPFLPAQKTRLTCAPNSDRNRCYSLVVPSQKNQHFCEPGHTRDSLEVNSWGHVTQTWTKSQVSNLEADGRHTGKSSGCSEKRKRRRASRTCLDGNERRGGATAGCEVCFTDTVGKVSLPLAPEIMSAPNPA